MINKKEFEITVKDSLYEYLECKIEFRNNYIFINKRILI